MAAEKAGLTRRETQVLELQAKGETWKGIADKLNLSLRTVEKYVERIKLKTGASSILAAFVRIMGVF